MQYVRTKGGSRNTRSWHFITKKGQYIMPAYELRLQIMKEFGLGFEELRQTSLINLIHIWDNIMAKEKIKKYNSGD